LETDIVDTDKALRNHLLALLRGRQAAMNFDDVVADFPPEKMNTFAPNVPYTPWHVIEHLRITQWDILDYMRNPDYREIEWPKDYWPLKDTKADVAAWQRTIESFRSDLDAVRAIVNDPKTDFYTPIPHGYGGHTILREVLLVADHNAYHIGELGLLRQILGAWPKGRQE
jgi:hypothetical protein